MSDPERVAKFLFWLTSNGAVFDKISWPEVDPISGLRGAHAKVDIGPDEVMLDIPARLMMSPPHAFADEEVGAALRSSADLLAGDLLLTVYIMHELRKGETSFYHPYLDILPVAQCLTEWRDEELDELQDERLKLRAISRRRSLRITFERCLGALARRYPAQFPPEQFPFEAFAFAWNSVQARAFGRRLPWTALVPLADCLNHNNLQTKYSFDNRFHLFPTGRNRYRRGEEVFNSYGRRPNDNLLLDYGFSLQGNQWDEVEICLGLDAAAQCLPLCELQRLLQTKREMLAALRMSAAQIFRFDRYRLPLQCLTFLRIVVSDAADLQHYLAAEDQGVQGGELDDDRVSKGSSPSTAAANRFRRPLSVAHEVRTLLALQRSIQQVLADMGSTLHEDEEMLQHDQGVLEEGVPRERRASALVYRMTRKRILLWNLALLADLLSALPPCTSPCPSSSLSSTELSLSSLYRDEVLPCRPALSDDQMHSSSDEDCDMNGTGRNSGRRVGYLVQLQRHFACLQQQLGGCQP